MSEAEKSAAKARFIIGVDIGGTFTDGVLLDQVTGSLWSTKVLTSERHEDAALAAIRELCGASGATLAGVSMLAHATTLASNTIILRRGAKVGLLTNKGFEDILYLAREGRYDTYNLRLAFVDPLVERSLCRGVTGRLLVDGTEFVALETGEVEEAASDWAAAGVEAVAVCFLHSYVDGAHEVAARAAAEGVLGDAVAVSLSSEVSPEAREYERCCTTVLNAYLQPVIGSYQERLRAGLSQEGYRQDMYVMLSSGGVTTVETASRFPVRMLESGPVAGVFAAAACRADARRHGRRRPRRRWDDGKDSRSSREGARRVLAARRCAGPTAFQRAAACRSNCHRSICWRSGPEVARSRRWTRWASSRSARTLLRPGRGPSVTGSAVPNLQSPTPPQCSATSTRRASPAVRSSSTSKRPVLRWPPWGHTWTLAPRTQPPPCST